MFGEEEVEAVDGDEEEDDLVKGLEGLALLPVEEKDGEAATKRKKGGSRKASKKRA